MCRLVGVSECVSVCLPVCLSASLSVCVSVCLSVYAAATELKADKISIPGVAPSFIITAAVIGYSALYLDQFRMMFFLSLQSLVVPVFKHWCVCVCVCVCVSSRFRP